MAHCLLSAAIKDGKLSVSTTEKYTATKFGYNIIFPRNNWLIRKRWDVPCKISKIQNSGVSSKGPRKIHKEKKFCKTFLFHVTKYHIARASIYKTWIRVIPRKFTIHYKLLLIHGYTQVPLYVKVYTWKETQKC